MSKLTELIEEMCPDGVEYRPLGEVVQIRNGRDWKTQEAGNVPVYGSGGRMVQTVAAASSTGPTVLLPRKGSLEVQYVDEPIWNVDTVFTTMCDPGSLDTRFFFFAMEATDLGRISTSATRPSLTQSALRKLPIPVPPLEVQREIVRVLDAFTDLEKNLASERELRKKQFDEYRTGAIKSLDRVDCRALGDVVQIRNGRDWKTQVSGDVPVYGSGGRMPQGVASPSSVGPAVLLPRKGSLEVQYVDEPIWNVDTVFTTACDTEVLDTRFFFHVMKTLDLGRISTSATRPSLTQSALRKLSIPVPPLEVQQEIVAKLDAFSDLIQSIEQEINLRRTQYEFYRDELLSFAPKED